MTDVNTAQSKSSCLVNNHIHTIYSFSPYTPADAVRIAKENSLATAGIMDHDSVAGALEFISAGAEYDLPVTVGCECRVSLAGTVFEGRRLNNPDQLSCAYCALHAIPHQMLGEVEKALAPRRHERNVRNRKMCEKLNTICADSGVALDFDRDVLLLSMHKSKGSVTERHLLFALAKKLHEKYPERSSAIASIERLIGEEMPEKQRSMLLSSPSKYYEYDMLGVLKSYLVSRFYIPATDELMHITEFSALAENVGAISAYAYLGDVTESVTGDKKAQKFEDDYLDELFVFLKKTGFRAVTFMPTRNTPEQLERVMSLCRRHGLFQISGEDINSPRQSFICKAYENPAYAHLTDAAYALIGHEALSAGGLEYGMFSPETIKKLPDLDLRIKYYSDIGRGTQNEI